VHAMHRVHRLQSSAPAPQAHSTKHCRSSDLSCHALNLA
jgi:hypothetical protein